jgi:ABC-2 type transport system ATP-binding protein
MKNGQVVFQGTVASLLNEARDKVWLLNSQGEKPEGNFTIVSMVNMGTYVQYRAVGKLAPRAGAQPVEPGLEDGYVWLMRDQHAPANGAAERWEIF